MREVHCTTADPSCQDPFRWDRSVLVAALSDFSAASGTSQRQHAQQLGLPHATFNYWVRHYSPDPLDPVASFFCSPPGEWLLRHILCSALVVFQQRAACGLRLIGDFLHLAQLDRFVASSRGALQPLATHLETDLAAFRDCHQPDLAKAMSAKAITVVADEHFHHSSPCLVAIEPVSNFILVECYRDQRDAATWTEVIQASTAHLPCVLVQLTSDQARGLLCCAHKGLEVAHSPDLFHGQRDLPQPLVLPLTRPIEQAQKDLEEVRQRAARLDLAEQTPLSWPQFESLVASGKEERAAQERLAQAQQHKEAALEEVRGLGDDYHPFDRDTGMPVEASEVGTRLQAHVEQLQEVVHQAGLGQRAQEALDKARQWLGTLVGCVAWFWVMTRILVESVELTQEQERVVYEKLLPGHYWEMAGKRARTAQERQRLHELAQKLKKEAWAKEGELAKLTEEERTEVEEIAKEAAGLFQRASSCVEGRNGRLALQQHGHSRVSQRRLTAQTVIHNYLVKRPDGTTAAQRFFGQAHADLFSWLVARLPDLPRPAQKRTKLAA